MKTIVVNLFGAPGAGKSVTAAELFAALKKRHITTELVREHVKEFVWAGGKPSVWDELWFFGEQVRREVTLYGRVEVLITDKPLLMHAFYSAVNGLDLTARGLLTCLEAHEQEMLKQGHEIINVYCSLPTDGTGFETAGRLHNFEQATKLDDQLFGFIQGSGRKIEVLDNFRTGGVGVLAKWLENKVKPEGDYTKAYVGV